MNNLDIYSKYAAVPKEAQKTISGGKLNGFTDINPMWRIKCLTEAFGPCGLGWFYTTKNAWKEEQAGEVMAFVQIELYVKYDGEWSQPIEGTGGSKMVQSSKNGPYASDECYKMATTDAISVACKQLGIGADVYWAAGRTKYSQQEELSQEKAKVSQEKAKAAPRKEEPKEERAAWTSADLSAISEAHIATIKDMAARKGYSERNICSLYKKTAFKALNFGEWNDAMAKLNAKPDKA